MHPSLKRASDLCLFHFQDMQHWPFKVIDKDGSPLIEVEYLNNEMKTFTPQEISAMVLAKMKEISETKLNKTVKKAVIT